MIMKYWTKTYSFNEELSTNIEYFSGQAVASESVAREKYPPDYPD